MTRTHFAAVAALCTTLAGALASGRAFASVLVLPAPTGVAPLGAPVLPALPGLEPSLGAPSLAVPQGLGSALPLPSVPTVKDWRAFEAGPVAALPAQESYASNEEIDRWLKDGTDKAMAVERDPVLAGADDEELGLLTDYLMQGPSALPERMNADPFPEGHGYRSILLRNGAKVGRCGLSAMAIVAEAAARGRLDLLERAVLGTPAEQAFGGYPYVHEAAVAQAVKLYRSAPADARLTEILKAAMQRPEPYTRYIILDGLHGIKHPSAYDLILLQIKDKTTISSGHGYTYVDYTPVLKLKAADALSDYLGSGLN